MTTQPLDDSEYSHPLMSAVVLSATRPVVVSPSFSWHLYFSATLRLLENMCWAAYTRLKPGAKNESRLKPAAGEQPVAADQTLTEVL